jgi:hypothetical protein
VRSTPRPAGQPSDEPTPVMHRSTGFASLSGIVSELVRNLHQVSSRPTPLLTP